MGRLTGSNHKDFLGTAMATDYENDISYDRNGNILALKRYGSDFNSFTGDCLTDDLAYLYSGNQVQRITNRALPLDETGETEEDPGTKYCFSYDSHGRITTMDTKVWKSATICLTCLAICTIRMRCQNLIAHISMTEANTM